MSGPTSLDPKNWDELRTLGHRMLDDMLDHIQHIRERPVWQPIPSSVRNGFAETVPLLPTPLAESYRNFLENIAPYATGNPHPGFMGWVHGGGTPVGMLAEMLAAGLNANLGGRDHMPIVVERQILAWVRELFAFPPTASGLFVTGTSMANFIAVLVARKRALGDDVRTEGVQGTARRLMAYTSQAGHGCIAKAMDMAGLGSVALRKISVDKNQRMDVDALARAIQADRLAGHSPFLVVATAGTVDVGAIDDLESIADLCGREDIAMHVDGAFGATAIMSPKLKPLLKGIERADSLAFDFHKWAQVPYDAGFILVRDGALHQSTFDNPAHYLGREARGLAAGSPWPCDFGPDLSRGFRALKTWFTLKTFGTEHLGRMMEHSCAVAQHLKARILAEPRLELLAPVPLNIVCFRYRAGDQANRDIVIALQEGGIVAPSTTVIDGKLAIRAAIFNHRTEFADVDRLVEQSVAIGGAL